MSKGAVLCSGLIQANQAQEGWDGDFVTRCSGITCIPGFVVSRGPKMNTPHLVEGMHEGRQPWCTAAYIGALLQYGYTARQAKAYLDTEHPGHCDHNSTLHHVALHAIVWRTVVHRDGLRGHMNGFGHGLEGMPC